MTIPLAAFLVAFAAAGLTVGVLANASFGKHIVDAPNDRSLHTVPTPRTGGLGLLAGAGVGWAALGDPGLALLAGPACFLCGTFFIDDVRGLAPAVRVALQVAVAVIFFASSPLAAGHWAVGLLVVPGLVWGMNLYNFMDGSNGLAGGMTVFGFGTYAVAAHASGSADLAIVNVLLAGAGLGFLLWNFDPARIFLGDAGSVTLGFLATGIGVLSWQRGIWPFWFPVMVFSPFIVDATVTLLRRALRGETLWRAHNGHYYQRLIRMGWSHRQLALSAYGLMAAISSSALYLRSAPVRMTIVFLVAWGLAYGVIAVAIDRRWVAFGRRAAQGGK